MKADQLREGQLVYNTDTLREVICASRRFRDVKVEDIEAAATWIVVQLEKHGLAITPRHEDPQLTDRGLCDMTPMLIADPLVNLLFVESFGEAIEHSQQDAQSLVAGAEQILAQTVKFHKEYRATRRIREASNGQ